MYVGGGGGAHSHEYRYVLIACTCLGHIICKCITYGTVSSCCSINIVVSPTVSICCSIPGIAHSCLCKATCTVPFPLLMTCHQFSLLIVPDLHLSWRTSHALCTRW